MSASPDSLSRTRVNAGGGSPLTGRLLADREAGEAPDDDVLPGLGRELRAELLDGLVGVLVDVDVGLAEEHDLVEPLAHPPLDDPGHDVLGLALGQRLLGGNALLALALLGRQLVLLDDERSRGRDVQRDVAGEGHEVVGAGHEVGLAVDLDEHADLAVAVDVGLDRALRGGAVAALGRLGRAADAEELDGSLHVAVDLLQGRLALHHPGARAVAQGLDVLGRDAPDWFSFSVSSSSPPVTSATALRAPPATSCAASTTPPATSCAASTTPPATSWAASATPPARSRAAATGPPPDESSSLVSSAGALSSAARAGSSGAGVASAGVASSGALSSAAGVASAGADSSAAGAASAGAA